MAACNCCAGVTSQTPVTVANRPGLASVAYRVGTHPQFLASMIADLTSADRPLLANLTTRDLDDLSIGLLDSWAIVGDVLTFHNERLAQESWLRTARQRRSLQELGRLVGHRMAPGVAAQTHLAFAVQAPPDVPPAAGRDPGVAPPVTPASVELPVGTRVQSIPGPGEQPQTFETVVAVVARSEHNAIPASASAPQVLAATATSAWLAGVDLSLAVGDSFLVTGSDGTWSLRNLTSVTAHTGQGRTEVTWQGGLWADETIPPTPHLPHVFRKRLKVFGHNAPLWRSMSDDFRLDYLDGGGDVGDWPHFHVTPDTFDQLFDVDGSHPEIIVDSLVALVAPAQRELFTVAATIEISRAEFAISGSVTRLELAGGGDYWSVRELVRELTVLVASEQLTLADRPDLSAVAGDEVVVDGDLGHLSVGTTIIVAGTTTAGQPHAEVATVAATSPLDTSRWVIDLEKDLVEVYDRSTVVVHANVALATHGETVDQILGSGRGRETFQQFRLSHAPVTHVQAAGTGGLASTLTVRVNGVAWTQVVTQYDGDPQDHTFTSTFDEHGDRVVTFGDGIGAARLPTGVNNVRATYRKGLGTPGNVPAGALAQLLDRPLGATGVTNPSVASGGVDPETVDQARTAIPLSVRTLGRAVSLLDYEDFARAFPGISKAQAVVLPLLGGRTIVTTVATTPGTGSDPTQRLADLETDLRLYGDPQVQQIVLAHHVDTFRLAMTVTADPAHDPRTVTETLRAMVAAAFSFAQRDLLAPIHQSGVIAVVHGVAGVVGVDLDRLYTVGQPLPPGLLADRLLARQPAVVAGKPVAAGLLVVADDPFDWLEVTS